MKCIFSKKVKKSFLESSHLNSNTVFRFGFGRGGQAGVGVSPVGGRVIAGIVPIVGSVDGHRGSGAAGTVQSTATQAAGGLQRALGAAKLVPSESVRGGFRQE